MPAGVKFNTYPLADVNLKSAEIIPGSQIEGFTKIKLGDKYFYAYDEGLKKAQENNVEQFRVFEDTPAFRAQLKGAIVEIDGKKVKSQDELSKIIQSYKPDDEVKIKTIILRDDRDSNVMEEKIYNIKLQEKDGRTILGIGYYPVQEKGLIGIFYAKTFAKIKNQAVFYESKIGVVGWFIYYLLWWIITVNLLVALFNMLPLGILDGGKFFYLTIWGITRSEKFAKKAFSFMTWIILLSLVLLMLRWGYTFF